MTLSGRCKIIQLYLQPGLCIYCACEQWGGNNPLRLKLTASPKAVSHTWFIAVVKLFRASGTDATQAGKINEPEHAQRRRLDEANGANPPPGLLHAGPAERTLPRNTSRWEESGDERKIKSEEA